MLDDQSSSEDQIRSCMHMKAWPATMKELSVSSQIILVTVFHLSLIVSCVRNGNECTEVPTEISSLLSLERSILCDEYNLQSLTEAFFPANRRQAFVVQVHFYLNRTEHPLQFILATEYNDTVVEPADYVLFWFSSSVLAFIEPRMLEGISFYTFSADFNYAHLRIAPFITDDEDWIRGLLTNATIWLKSYAENRLISISEGVTISSQGFSAYKPDVNTDDYFIYNPRLLFYQTYVILLGVSFTLIVVFVGISVPITILEQYSFLCELAGKEKRQDIRFRFHNLFWSVVLTLGCIVIAAYAFAIWHIYIFGLRWNTTYRFIYPMFICGLIAVFFAGVFSALLVVRRVKKDGTLIRIPRLLYSIFGLNPDKPPDKGSAQRLVLIGWQAYGVFVTEVSVILIAFSFCGILLALFVDPIQVITSIAIYATTFLCLVYAFGIVFELHDGIRKKPDKSIKSRIRLYLKLFVLLVVFMLLIIFVIMFGFTYAAIVLFAGSADNLDIFTTFGDLFPVILASLIGWILRNEFLKYFDNADTSSTGKAVETAEPVTDEMPDTFPMAEFTAGGTSVAASSSVEKIMDDPAKTI